MLAATSVTACTTDNGEPAPIPTQEAALDGLTCEAQKTKEPCTDIEVDGRIWRYAYLPATQKTSDTVVLDFGGPGHSVLSGEVGLSAFLTAFPALQSRYNIVVPEEPWVTQAVSTECQDAQSRYYLAAREASATVDTVAKDMASRCGLADSSQRWGFDAPTYQKLIETINARHGLTLKGFIGHSWGSVRLTYLDAPKLDWAILVRPFPVGTDQATLIAERAVALADLQAGIRPVSPTAVAGRSLPVMAFDQYSAVVDLGYINDQSFDEISPHVLDGTDTVQIGRLSDGLWMRYGRDSISPGSLAQLQETCASAGEVPALPTEVTSVTDILRLRQAPCHAMPATPVKPEFAPSMCVVTSPRDTVTPGKLVRSTYADTSTRVRFVESTQRSHSSFAGLDECLTEYTDPATP
ncbi:hypothetical protein [Saccharomonospora azurea]|uniref:hypothetical protein n=1 Tax=Saccharomonospora azurea TaxID=40988 RepID=UPI000255FB0C|nr:hypothetical protein [Saccharomonospora azurea]